MAPPLYLTEAEHKRVSDAVARAEAGTSGEIVTVLAERSDGYSDVALAWSAFVAFLALAALAIAPGFYLGLYDALLADWGHEWSPRAVLVLAMGVATIKFAAMLALQQWQPLRFFLVPGPIRTRRVHERATRAFRLGAQQRTTGRTGILVYVSMREHRAEVLADEAIATRVDPVVWAEAVTALVAEVREGRVADGMIAAVERIGRVLAVELPRAHDDVNELPDRLIEV